MIQSILRNKYKQCTCIHNSTFYSPTELGNVNTAFKFKLLPKGDVYASRNSTHGCEPFPKFTSLTREGFYPGKLSGELTLRKAPVLQFEWLLPLYRRALGKGCGPAVLPGFILTRHLASDVHEYKQETIISTKLCPSRTHKIYLQNTRRKPWIILSGRSEVWVNTRLNSSSFARDLLRERQCTPGTQWSISKRARWLWNNTPERMEYFTAYSRTSFNWMGGALKACLVT